MSGKTIEVPDAITRALSSKHCFIKDPEFTNKFITVEGTVKAGAQLVMRDFTGNDNQKFEFKYQGGDKGWSIGSRVDTRQVLCTSRNDYASDRQYREAGHPIWLWDWMNGGNQFWNVSKRYHRNSYAINNTHSGFPMSIDGTRVTHDYNEIRWEIYPQDVKLHLMEVQCVRPATSINLNANNLVAEIATLSGFSLSAIGLLAVAANPFVGISIAGAGFVVSSASLGTWAAAKSDSSRDPDDLYITVNGTRKWPVNKEKETVRGGNIIRPNLEIANAPGRYTVRLNDYDYNWIEGRNDDFLGEVTIDLQVLTKKGEYKAVVASKKEDSVYILTFDIS